MKVYFIWLIGIILWNFGFPDASPSSDVVVAILLAYTSQYLSGRSKIGQGNMFAYDKENYWKENIRLIIRCLSVWFIFSYGFGIVLVDYLNLIKIGGFKLGFWFAQQGSIYVFVILIFYYSSKMGVIDEKYRRNNS